MHGSRGRGRDGRGPRSELNGLRHEVANFLPTTRAPGAGSIPSTFAPRPAPSGSRAHLPGVASTLRSPCAPAARRPPDPTGSAWVTHDGDGVTWFCQNPEEFPDNSKDSAECVHSALGGAVPRSARPSRSDRSSRQLNPTVDSRYSSLPQFFDHGAPCLCRRIAGARRSPCCPESVGRRTSCGACAPLPLSGPAAS